MSHKTQVLIVLRSRNDGEEVVQELPAELIVKGSDLYVRYEEPDEGPQGGTTRTTMKITKDGLKIMRHGEVQSENSFQLGERLPGFYRSPFTTFNLSTLTTKMDIQIEGWYGQVSWAYDLYVYEDLSGQFEIDLHIQEEHKS
ncbi:YwiB family protein [Paenibacillus sp. CMAA1364]